MPELNEVVKALRWLSKVRTYCDTHMVNCRECEFHGFCTDPDSGESIGEQAKWTGQAASLLESQQKRIEALEERQRWIPVGERLPENNNTVEVYSLAFGVFDAWYESEESQWYTRGHAIKNVTHWRLPNPPEKG